MRECLHLQQRYESTAVATSKQFGCTAPVPRFASLTVEETWLILTLCHCLVTLQLTQQQPLDHQSKRRPTHPDAAFYTPCLRGYLQIKHPYEVGALRVVFDEADDSGVLQAPCGWTVRQSHVQLCYCSGHGLKKKTTDNIYIYRIYRYGLIGHSRAFYCISHVNFTDTVVRTSLSAFICSDNNFEVLCRAVVKFPLWIFKVCKMCS